MGNHRRIRIAISIVIVSAIIITSCMFIVERAATNPNLRKHAGAKETLDQFYTEFVHSNAVNGKMADLLLYGGDNMLVLYREYYGDPQTYRIKKIKDLNAGLKEAKVSVETILRNGKKLTAVDTMQLVYTVEGRWLIRRYNTTNKVQWPKLP